jgi:acyl-homoserine-lactone acylase
MRTPGWLLLLLLLATAPLAQQAEILWDDHGVPHIYADETEDLFYGFGWAQMESHGEVMLRLYGLASGRAAEHWGAAFLDHDRRAAASGARVDARRAIAAWSPEMRRYVSAFASGVNAFAEAHPARLADSLRLVLPITEEDVALRVVMSFRQFSDAARMSRQWAVGSNAWAVTGPKSASGNAMLLANPHLPFTDHFRFYEARLASPDFEIYGVTFIGLPMIGIGFNRQLGWTHTVTPQDFEDFYELRLADGGYVFDGEVRPFDADTTVLRIRQPGGGFASDTLVARRSVHGPVIAASGDRALAARWVAADGVLDQWWDMARAGSMAEFEEAAARQQVVGFTITYADRDGNILHHYGAASPERATGDRAFWQGVVPGDTSATLWHDVHAYHDLPRLANPESGWVQNANEASFWGTWPPPFGPRDFPDYIGPDDIHFRAQRSLNLLDTPEALTFDAFSELRRDLRLELADRLVPDLVAAAREHGGDTASRAADVLDAWDRTARAESRGGVLFNAWYAAMGARRVPVFAQPWSEDDPRGTPAGLADPAGAVAALETAAAQLLEQAGALDVPWGAVNRLRMGDLDVPASGAPGHLGAFRVFTFRPAGDGHFEAVHGDTFVLVVEFGDEPRAEALLTYGNATAAGSPHRTDQVERAASGELRPVRWLRAEVEANMRGRTVLDRQATIND